MENLEKTETVEEITQTQTEEDTNTNTNTEKTEQTEQTEQLAPDSEQQESSLENVESSLENVTLNQDNDDEKVAEVEDDQPDQVMSDAVKDEPVSGMLANEAPVAQETYDPMEEQMEPTDDPKEEDTVTYEQDEQMEAEDEFGRGEMIVESENAPLGNQEVGEQEEEEKDKRITTRFITKYERARVLGVRATQIAMGAPVMIQLNDETDPLEIANKEMRQGKLPIIIRRILPGGKKYEDWHVNELDDPQQTGQRL